MAKSPKYLSVFKKQGKAEVRLRRRPVGEESDCYGNSASSGPSAVVKYPNLVPSEKNIKH